MFNGHYTYAINEKGRLSIPSKFREELISSGYNYVKIANGMDPCLTAYPPDVWEEVARKVRQNASMRKAISYFNRHVSGSLMDCEIDAQGRVLIPAGLREYAGLVKKCRIVGTIDRFEIWDVDRYEQFMQQDKEDYRDQLAELGL